MKTKEEIINEIKQVFGSLGDDISARTLAAHVDKILDMLSGMEKIESGCTGDAIYALSHTLGKEVEHAKYDEKEMNKKNAAQKRKNEYRQAMSKAISQIRSDLWIIIRLE